MQRNHNMGKCFLCSDVNGIKVVRLNKITITDNNKKKNKGYNCFFDLRNL